MVCGRGPSLGKKIKQAGRGLEDELRSAGKSIDDEIFDDMLGNFMPVGKDFNSDDLKDQAKIAAAVAAAYFGGPAVLSGAQTAGSAVLSGIQTVGGTIMSGAEAIGSFMSNPMATLKSLPGLQNLPDQMLQGLGEQLGGLPQDAMQSALQMLSGADPSGVYQTLGQGGGLMDLVSAIGGGVVANNANKDILQQNERMFNQAMDLQRETRDIGIERSEPFAQAGVQTLPQLGQVASQGPPTLGETGTTLEEVNPLVSFLRDEGFRDIEERAAARGKFGSGGTLRDLARFNTQLTSTIVPQLQQQKFGQMLQRGQFAQQGQQQQFGQLFDVARLGANAVSGQNTLGSTAAANIGNLQTQLAGQQQQGMQNKAGDLVTTIQNLSKVYGAR